MQEKARVLQDIGYIVELGGRYRIDYLVSRKPLSQPFLSLAYANDHYWLYRR